MPNLFKRIWLRLRYARRISIFNRARRRGLSVEEARAYADRLFPQTAEDEAYEAEFMRKELDQDPAEAREWAVKDFRKMAETIRRSDEAGDFAFAVNIATNWKAFLSAHGSPAKFAELSRADQMEYFMKWLRVCADLKQRSQDKERLFAAQIITHYLGAVINKDREFEVEVAKFCDEYASKGWNLV